MSPSEAWRDVQVYADGFGRWHALTNDPGQALAAIAHQLTLRGEETIGLAVTWQPVTKQYAEEWSNYTEEDPS